MKSIWSLYKGERDNADDTASISSRAMVSSLTGLTTQVGSKTAISSFNALDIKVDSYHGYNVGSVAERVINVASPSAVIPAAGTMTFETTRKIPLFSDGTSMFLATGSLA